MDIQEIAGSLGKGKEIKTAEGWLTCCPVHGDDSPSLSIKNDGNGGVLVNCHAGCDWRGVKDEIKALGLINSSQKSNLPAFIWSKSSRDDQTIKKYLSNRNINIDQIPNCLRLNKYKSSTMIVAEVRRPGDSETVAIHRTFLDENYKKIGRKMLGKCGSRAVWLSDPVEKMLIGEGIETTLAAMVATGIPGAACLSASGMKKVMIPDQVKEIIILVDSDPNRAGQKAAQALAKRFPGKVQFAIPDETCFTDKPNKLDFNDLDPDLIRERFENLTVVTSFHAEQLRDIAESNRKAAPTEEILSVPQLALLSAIEYDKARIDTAKAMEIRTSTLDREVEKLRQHDDNSGELFEEIEPWPEEVAGADLLNEIRDIIDNHLIIQPGVNVATTLWVLLTYCFDTLRILPLLGVTSPEKRCGKTTFAEVLEGLVFNAVVASNISSAVLFRLIEKYSPTLLVDEADTFLVDNDELRGVFNAGHTRKSAFVWRVNTETLEPEKFSVWGPKVVLMIGDLPGTMEDRSIRVRMKRKAPGETVKKLTLDFEDDHLHIRQKCVRWCADNSLMGADPDIPFVGNDRASDNWLPLLAFADKVGGEWPELGRSAMLILEHDDLNESDSAGQMLLTDIKKIFDKTKTERIFSNNLVDQLTRINDRPWCEWRQGKPLTQNTLSNLLKPFGISSKQIRLGEDKRRGYELKSFQDSFKRYLPSGETAFQGGTTVQDNNINKLDRKQSGTTNANVPLQKQLKSLKLKECTVVPLQNPEMGAKGTKECEFEGWEEM